MSIEFKLNHYAFLSQPHDTAGSPSHPIHPLRQLPAFRCSPALRGGTHTTDLYVLDSFILCFTVDMDLRRWDVSHAQPHPNGHERPASVQAKKKNLPQKNHRIPTYHTYTVVIASFGFACLPTCPESSITFELFHPMCYNIHRFCLLAPKFLLFLAQTHQQNPKHVNTTPRGSSPRGTERRVLLQDFHVRYIRACATLTHSST